MKRRQNLSEPVWIGEETARALTNFPFSTPPVPDELTRAMILIKKAAALANKNAGDLPPDIADAVVASCDTLLSDPSLYKCPLPFLQGGAGTSANMFVNEIIAHRAKKLLQKVGKNISVHPLDHVNRSQSTNDVNPSALKLACLPLVNKLTQTLSRLSGTFKKKGKEFGHVVKVGRTHLQDAVPMSVGAMFDSYATTISRNAKRLGGVRPYLLELNLGGTAIGTSINASKKYQTYVYKQLRNVSGYPVRPADNLVAATSSQTDFLHLISIIAVSLTDLSKIASDIRLLSSGPRAGLGELKLPELQKGSTIMPGKVNPVLPESVNQTYFMVSGYAQSVREAVAAAQLELGVMFPVIAYCLLTSISVTIDVIGAFDKLCIRGLVVDMSRCKELVEASMVYATLLTPNLGYDAVEEAVKEAIAQGKPLRTVIVGKGLLRDDEFDRLIKQSVL